MEYVDGMSLEEFLSQVEGNSLTYDEAACIADALVQAVAYAHENGVLHLDIKPANVLIDRSGHVKITDFGMATLTSAAGFGGARGGTIGYMPPSSCAATMWTSAATSSRSPASSTNRSAATRPSARARPSIP